MGYHDHYVFMDGCIVKGCRPVIDFDRSFGEYAALLRELYRRGGWGRGARRVLGVPVSESFDSWAATHVHTAQSTQNMGTGSDRVERIVQVLKGPGNVHLFGTSAAGAAMLEYFLRTAPNTLYWHARDPLARRLPRQKFTIHPQIASFTAIDAPTDWIPLRRGGGPGRSGAEPGTLGAYLAKHTRIKTGPGTPPGEHTTRLEDVPGTWVGAVPIAGLDYDNDPHYDYLPEEPLARHIYTGGHMSHETRAFLERVWR